MFENPQTVHLFDVSVVCRCKIHIIKRNYNNIVFYKAKKRERERENEEKEREIMKGRNKRGCIEE